jgi:hypothetical protein
MTLSGHDNLSLHFLHVKDICALPFVIAPPWLIWVTVRQAVDTLIACLRCPSAH